MNHVFTTPVELWKEEDIYLARSMLFEIISQGETPMGALENLQEALELALEDEDFLAEFEKKTGPYLKKEQTSQNICLAINYPGESYERITNSVSQAIVTRPS